MSGYPCRVTGCGRAASEDALCYVHLRPRREAEAHALADQCPRCDGSGGLLSTEGEDVDCPRCGGTGKSSPQPSREQIAEWRRRLLDRSYEFDADRRAELAATLTLLQQPTDPGIAADRSRPEDWPAPPSIADMAPGTTFTADVHGEDFLLKVAPSGRLLWAGWRLTALMPEHIDPTTVRDVILPKES